VVIDPNPITIFRTVFFQQSIIAVVLMWGILLACCSLGAMVNSQLCLHRSVALFCGLRCTVAALYRWRVLLWHLTSVN
jgi:hypothetical protein